MILHEGMLIITQDSEGNNIARMDGVDTGGAGSLSHEH